MNIVLMTAFAFILLREVQISDSVNNFLAPLSRASFGVYLAHVIVLAELEKIPFISGWFSMSSSEYMIDCLFGLFCCGGDYSENSSLALDRAVKNS